MRSLKHVANRCLTCDDTRSEIAHAPLLGTLGRKMVTTTIARHHLILVARFKLQSARELHTHSWLHGPSKKIGAWSWSHVYSYTFRIVHNLVV